MFCEFIFEKSILVTFFLPISTHPAWSDSNHRWRDWHIHWRPIIRCRFAAYLYDGIVNCVHADGLLNFRTAKILSSEDLLWFFHWRWERLCCEKQLTFIPLSFYVVQHSPCLIRRCRFSVGKSVGRTGRFVDELEPLLPPSICTERSIMIFLQMSLLDEIKEKRRVRSIFHFFTARLPQSVGNCSRRRLTTEHVTHVNSC